MNRRVSFASLLPTLLGILAGCAGVQYTSSYPPPAEAFAEHDAAHPFFDLHWSLERGGGWVVAQGIVTASRIDAIRDVSVEVVGLDEAGTVLSRALGRAYGNRMSRWESRPFFIWVRPTGREARFDVRVWSFRHEFGNGANGSRPN